MYYLTIVIPVYNLESYIRRCLDSIFHQDADEREYEVIAVDDGSTDQSHIILEDYASKHPNMRVFKQPNKGVSTARNLGIDNSNAPFLTFVDGDDELYEGSLRALTEAIKDCGNFMDVIYCRAFVRDSSNSIHESHLWYGLFQTGHTYNGSDLIKQTYINGGSVWGGAYSKNFLKEKGLRFGEGIANGEDTIFNYLLYSYDSQIQFYNIKLYQANFRSGSASHSYSLQRVNKFKNNILYLIDYKMTHQHLSRLTCQAINMGLYHSISLAVNMYISLGYKDWRYLYQLLCIKLLWRLSVPWAPMHQRLKMFILTISFRLYFLFIKIKTMRRDVNA